MSKRKNGAMSGDNACHDPRFLIIARDSHPAFRVDITVLFSKYLVQEYRLDWVMRDAKNGKPRIDISEREQVFVIGGRGLMRFFSATRVHLSAIKRIFSGHYALVQCRDAFLIAWLYAVIARLAGVPFTYWMSYPMELGYLDRAKNDFRKGRIFRALGRGLIGGLGWLSLYGVALPLACHVFVQSQRMKLDVARKSIPALKITAVPMAIDLSKPEMLRSQSQKTNTEPCSKTIVYTGTLDPARRMAVPAEGVAMYCANHPNCRFIIIGSASQNERDIVGAPFRARHIENQLDFIDFMPWAEMLGYVQVADVCLAPYPDDTKMLASATPTKLIEYVATGRRVVANFHPDQTYIANATLTTELCVFSPEGFHTAIDTAMRLGSPSTNAARRAAAWVLQERSYAKLSVMVKNRYSQILTSVIKP